MLLSVFVAVDCAAAQPVPASVESLNPGTERAERPAHDHCPDHVGGCVQLVIPGSPFASSPSQSSSRSGCGDDGTGTEGDSRHRITAPRAARHAVPLTRSGQLPIAFKVFRC
jgi:hypothetical protein